MLFDTYHCGAFFAARSRFVSLANFEITLGYNIVMLADRLPTVGEQTLHIVQHLIDLLGDWQSLNAALIRWHFIIAKRGR